MSALVLSRPTRYVWACASLLAACASKSAPPVAPPASKPAMETAPSALARRVQGDRLFHNWVANRKGTASFATDVDPTRPHSTRVRRGQSGAGRQSESELRHRAVRQRSETARPRTRRPLRSAERAEDQEPEPEDAPLGRRLVAPIRPWRGSSRRWPRLSFRVPSSSTTRSSTSRQRLRRHRHRLGVSGRSDARRATGRQEELHLANEGVARGDRLGSRQKPEARASSHRRDPGRKSSRAFRARRGRQARRLDQLDDIRLRG